MTPEGQRRLESNADRLSAIHMADEKFAKRVKIVEQKGDGANRSDKRHLKRHNDSECTRCKRTAMVIS